MPNSLGTMPRHVQLLFSPISGTPCSHTGKRAHWRIPQTHARQRAGSRVLQVSGSQAILPWQSMAARPAASIEDGELGAPFLEPFVVVGNPQLTGPA